MHHEFKEPVKAFVFGDFLGSEYIGITLPCKIMGVSTYPNETVTFMILVEGALFYELPFHAFSRFPTESRAELNELVYSNCKGGNFNFHFLNFICYGKVEIYKKTLDTWVAIKHYLGSLDFYEDNDLLHLFIGDDGRFYAMPNHKIMFNGSRTFPKFEKQRNFWRV